MSFYLSLLCIEFIPNASVAWSTKSKREKDLLPKSHSFAGGLAAALQSLWGRQIPAFCLSRATMPLSSGTFIGLDAR